MKNNDAELIQRVLEGDDDAFSVLVRKYQKQVHALAWRKIGDFHIAEEITQDTFLKAYKRLSTLKKPQRFVSWLYVIAANRCSSWLRKKRLWTQPLEEVEETDDEQRQKATYSGYVAAENERTTAEAQRDVVKKLLAKLQESERTIMTLHYFGEMSCTEIGVFLGVSKNTIKSRLRRAQQRLKEEEPMIREALENFQITPNLTENIMREIARIKPAAPSGGKPFMPWAIAASTVAVVLLMLGIGSQQHALRFQKPYNLNAASEMTIELIETPIVLNVASKPDKRTQIGNTNTPGGSSKSEEPPDDVPAFITEAHADEVVEDYTQWHLPKEATARFGKGGITALQFSPDGTQIAVGSKIGVWLYDLKTGKEINMFRGMCQSIAFSPDGRFIAKSGGEFKFHEGFELWEIATGHRLPITDVVPSASILQFSSNGKTLISLNDKADTISRFNLELGTENMVVLEGHPDPESEGIPKAHAITNDKVAIGTWDGKVHLWEITTGKKLSTFRGHAELPNQLLNQPSHLPLPMLQNQKQVLALAFSPDGTRFASGSKDTTVRLWHTISDDEPTVLQKHTSWANVLTFSPDGKMLATGSTDKTVNLWDTDTGELITTLTGHLNGVVELSFSPDGKTLASGSTDGTIKFWNTETGDLLPVNITGHTEWVKAVSFIKDIKDSSTLASVAFNGVITFWDLETSRNPDFQSTGHRDLLKSLAFSPNGTRLVSIGAKSNMVAGFGSVTTPDSLIRLKNVSTGREIATLKDNKGASNLTFSPDRKTVAFSNHNEIRLWNTETETVLDIPLLDPKNNDREKLRPSISVLLFSPDGKKLVSGTMEGNIQMWDTETGIGLFSLTELDPDNVKHGLKKAAEANSDATIEVTISPDGALVTTTYQEPITALAFSPNGELLAAGSYQQIRLWNMETGNWRKGITSINRYKEDRQVFHGAEVLMFSPDNKTLVNGDKNGKIQLWDIPTGEKIKTLKGHTQPVETLLFSPDGKILVSTGQDGTILVWDWNEALKGSPEAEKQ